MQKLWRGHSLKVASDSRLVLAASFVLFLFPYLIYLNTFLNFHLMVTLFHPTHQIFSWSQWPRGLRRLSAAARLLRLWVRIPPGTSTFVCCVCCHLEVSATSWSLVQSSTTDCGASLCVISKQLVPVAARSKALVCGRSPAEIVGSNPTGGIDVCLLCVLSLRGLCDKLITRPE